MARVTYRGLVKDTDPRYKGGSTLYLDVNLNPSFVQRSIKPAVPVQQPSPQPQNAQNPPATPDPRTTSNPLLVGVAGLIVGASVAQPLRTASLPEQIDAGRASGWARFTK